MEGTKEGYNVERQRESNYRGTGQGGKQKEKEVGRNRERRKRKGKSEGGKNMRGRNKNDNPSPLVRIWKEDIPLHSIEKALNHLQGEIKPLAWHPAASL